MVGLLLWLWLRVGGAPRRAGKPNSVKQLCSSLTLRHPARRHGAVESTHACLHACAVVAAALHAHMPLGRPAPESSCEVPVCL